MATSAINVIANSQFYIEKIVKDSSISGMKAFLLDSVTTKIVSMVYSQTQIVEQEVYLVEQLGKPHEAMNHLKAVVIIQPTEANADALIRELKEPKFSEYNVFFTNIVSKDIVTRLARADEHEVVKQVQEYYADFLAVNEDFVQLGVENSISLSSSSAPTLESGQLFERNVSGVLAFLLSSKRRPSQIRYQAGSDLSRKLATEISGRIERDDIFDSRRSEGPLLLILDRRDDPITPLLTQWTYQAMVHELLGLKNNRVILRGAPNVSKDLEEVVLSVIQDDFFARHRYANFGDLGDSVKHLLDEYQQHAKVNENINSIQDMQAFLERYPAFRAKSLNVSKHVAIMSELARLTDRCQLLDISQLEQEIACGNDHSTHKRDLLERIQNPRVQNADKLRLTLLFLLRYESYNEARELKMKLSEKGLGSQQLALIDATLDYAGESKRSNNGLFLNGGFIANIGRTFKSSLMEEAPKNVYTQHLPVLSSTLEAISKNKLKDSSFPVVWGSGVARASEVIVFFVGGATYEEATKVAEFNASNPGMRVILGGSCIHNSTSFIKEILATFGK